MQLKYWRCWRCSYKIERRKKKVEGKGKEKGRKRKERKWNEKKRKERKGNEKKFGKKMHEKRIFAHGVEWFLGQNLRKFWKE